MASPVATLVVTYQSEEHIHACVASAPRPVWVIDNSPQPGPALPDGVRQEHHPENLGFAGGVNRGFVLSSEPYVLILNPDCVIEKGVEAMVAELQADPRVGAVGGLLLDARTGQPQEGFTLRRFPAPLSLACEVLGLNRLFPWNPVNRKYRCADLNLAVAQDADQPAGAFLMVRREAFAAVGGFDTRFHPVWFEDVDFCKRLKTAGWKVRYTPGAVARHTGGHSVGRMPAASKTQAWYGSLQWYAAKHFARSGRWLVALSLLGSALPRGVAGMLREGRPSLLGLQLRIAALAVKRLIFEDLRS
jgi:GT2 family glycosyltransferase